MFTIYTTSSVVEVGTVVVVLCPYGAQTFPAKKSTAPLLRADHASRRVAFGSTVITTDEITAIGRGSLVQESIMTERSETSAFVSGDFR
jgi:hypothetical protein